MIIFLYGADTFRSRRFLQELKNKFTREVDPQSGSLSVLDGQILTLKDLIEKINTGSLFVTKRLVVIENVFKNKKNTIFNELSDFLSKQPSGENNIIIFRDEELNTKNQPLPAAAKKLFAFLSRQPYSREFLPLAPGPLLTFIKKEAQTYDREIGAAAATLLSNLSGGDLWLITGALKKLSFRSDQKLISPDDVKEMVVGYYDENIFGLTDALSAKNKTLALSLLEEQYAAGLSDEYLLTMLTRQIKILLQLRTALDRQANPATLAADLKLHPFIVKKGLLQAKNFSAAALRGYLDYLISLDFANKTGRGHIKTELVLLISRL